MNLPDYEFLSAPLWLITVLHLVTLTLHFVAMNFLFGGVIMVLYAGARRRWDDPTLKKFGNLLPSAMAATVTLGVAPLLFVQLVYHRQVYGAAIVSGWWWLGVIGVAIVVYYALYRSALKSERTGTISLPALGLALLGLLYISVTYSSVFSMAERPEQIHALYQQDQMGLTLNPALGDYAMRWLHMMLGAVTVGGFFVGWIGRDRPEVYALGKRVFLWGMILASVAGVAYLMTLRPILLNLMRHPAMGVLTVGILLAAGALHFFFTKKFAVSGSLLLVSMLTMVYARHTVRLLKLAGQFDPTVWRVAPQWSVFGLFLVCFVVMLGVVGYMLKLFFRPNHSGVSVR